MSLDCMYSIYFMSLHLFIWQLFLKLIYLNTYYLSYIYIDTSTDSVVFLENTFLIYSVFMYNCREHINDWLLLQSNEKLERLS